MADFDSLLSKRHVAVVWVDASDPPGRESWYEDPDLEKFAKDEVTVVTTGFIWSDTKLYLTIVSDVMVKGIEKATYGRPTKIPKGMIRAIRDVPLPSDVLTTPDELAHG